MKSQKVPKEKDWMIYLQRHPKYAEELIQKAEAQEITSIAEKYKSVIIAYRWTEFKLHGLVAEIIKLEERCEEEGDSPKLIEKLQKAHACGEKEWNRLSYEFALKHGKHYEAYEKELASAKARFEELRALILPTNASN